MLRTLRQKLALAGLFFWSTTSFSEQLVSPYHKGFGQMTIEMADAGHYLVSWDPNSCFYDKYGDVAGCTKMAVQHFESRVKVDFHEEKKWELIN